MATTLVLGAGSSLSSALHFHGHRRTAENPPLDSNFFERIESLNIPVPADLRRYASTMSAVDPFEPSGGPPVRMEEFFKELFGDFQDQPTSGSLPSRAYAELVDIYVRVLRETTNWLCADSRSGSPVGRMIAQLAEATDDLTIVTFNHDLVIENELFRRARLRRRWCLTEGYGSFGTGLTVSAPSGAPTRELFPRHSSDCDHSRPITLYKLHGSLNWYVRLRGRQPTRTVLAGGATKPNVQLTRRRTVASQLRHSAKRTGRGRTSWYTWPVVIPPVHEKDRLIRSYLQPVWQEARRALLRADRVVFCGYSLPVLDTGAERLFQRALSRSSTLPFVEVVDPSPAAAARYSSLLPRVPLHWYPGVNAFLSR